MSTTTYGTKVTPENVDLIISHVRDFSLNGDYLKDNLEYYTEDGIELYAIFSCNDETGGKTFNEMVKPDFFRNWKFRHPENIEAHWLQIIDPKL